MQPARYWERLAEDRVICRLCSHGCHIAAGGLGLCGVRANQAGELFSMNYGRLAAAAVDPIEKKPLFHFLPGTLAYSVASVGCNLSCQFCQNFEISQYPRLTGRIAGDNCAPDEAVRQAVKSGSRTIAYTYTEPTIFMEYVFDTARLAREQGLRNILVTNGFTSTEVIRTEFPQLIDAANVDLKSFSERFYRELCGARLKPVLQAIEAYLAAGVWIEVTTLLIPGENDSDEELKQIARFIKGLSSQIPWHISRYYPRYSYHKAPPTDAAALERARNIGLAEGLEFVYIGNVVGQVGENTVCPACGRDVIARKGFSIVAMNMHGSLCGHCGHPVAGCFE